MGSFMGGGGMHFLHCAPGKSLFWVGCRAPRVSESTETITPIGPPPPVTFTYVHVLHIVIRESSQARLQRSVQLGPTPNMVFLPAFGHWLMPNNQPTNQATKLPKWAVRAMSRLSSERELAVALSSSGALPRRSAFGCNMRVVA